MLAPGSSAGRASILAASGVEAFPFHDFEPNPDSAMVEKGRACAAALAIDSIVGLGGGSSMDCAKGVNFVLSNGGTMKDYQGWGKAERPMLPIDRNSDHGRHGQRGAVLRVDLGRRVARQDGVRRPQGRLPRGYPGPGADRVAAASRQGRRRATTPSRTRWRAT